MKMKLAMFGADSAEHEPATVNKRNALNHKGSSANRMVKFASALVAASLMCAPTAAVTLNSQEDTLYSQGYVEEAAYPQEALQTQQVSIRIQGLPSQEDLVCLGDANWLFLW